MASSGFLPQAKSRLSGDHGIMSKIARPKAYTAVQRKVGEHIGWVRQLVIENRSEAARIMGMDPSTLAKIEDGDRPPNIFQVIEIANRFRVSTDFILRGLLIAHTDEEMALRLAAQHPELVRSLPAQPNTAQDKDTAPAVDKHRTTKKPVRVG